MIPFNGVNGSFPLLALVFFVKDLIQQLLVILLKRLKVFRHVYFW